MAANAMNQLEAKLDTIFEKNAPKLPAGAKKVIVQYAPWVSLIVGLLSLWAAWALWGLAHTATAFIDYANQLSAAYGGSITTTVDMTLWVWLALAVLVVEAVLYLLAFPGLRDRKKAGWNYLYWGALLNVAYAVVSLFVSYSGVGSFIGALIGSAIGLWLLFQVRSSYMGSKHATSGATSSSSTK